MSKPKDTIHIQLFQNSKGGVKSYLDPETTQTIQRLYDSGKKDHYWERISEKKARSNQQNKYYWKNVLRIICANVDGMSAFATQSASGAFNYEKAHRYLTLKFCLETSRTSLIEVYKTYVGGKWIDVPYCSFSFDKMKHEDATAYLKWLEDKLISICGHGFDTFLENE
jgi:hypothetical protein